MPKTLQIYFPFKPFNQTQDWGNPNPAYAAQFDDPSFKLHNGIDAVTTVAEPDGSYKKGVHWPVYCPVAGFKVLSVDYAPQGGGNEIWLISKEKYKMFELECYALIALCHADKVFVQAGYEPQLGELLMASDNTGFSTGEHTHMGLYRVDYNGTWFTKLDVNEATGSFNPALFFTSEYAVDQPSTATLIKNNLRYYQYVLTGK